MSDETVLRIVRGKPNDEEVAALTVAILAMSGPDATQPKPISRWATAIHRTALRPGPDTWRGSALPR